MESGRAGAFDPGKSLESFRAAERLKSSLQWSTYALCTNVDVTGAAEAKIRAECPDIDIRSRVYWIAACERFADAVVRNFRQVLRIPERRTIDAVRSEFSKHYSDDLQQLLAKENVPLFLYSDRHEKVYQLPVSLDFRVLDLIRVLSKVFALPSQLEQSLAEPIVLLSHSLAFGNNRLSPEKTLRESGLSQRDVITYWTDIEITDQHGNLRTSFMHRDTTTPSLPSADDTAIATKCYEAVRAAFSAFDQTISEEFVS